MTSWAQQQADVYELYGADMECINTCRDQGWAQMNACVMESGCDVGEQLTFGPSDYEPETSPYYYYY